MIEPLRADYATKGKRITVPRELMARIHVSMLGKLDGMAIWRVNAAVVRDEVDIDFTQGGNPGRYTYNPLGELWIEDTLRPYDAAATALHEFVEYRKMVTRGMYYETAHGFALIEEKKFRAAVKSGAVRVTGYRSVVTVVRDWLDSPSGTGGNGRHGDYDESLQDRFVRTSRLAEKLRRESDTYRKTSPDIAKEIAHEASGYASQARTAKELAMARREPWARR
jgi:hypothetical protein